MQDNFNRCFDLIIGHEGKLSTDRGDKGNWTGGEVGRGIFRGTKYGVSAAGYPKLNIAGLTLEDARLIYKRDFWDHFEGDKLFAGLDYAVFDFAINSYWMKAVMTLQDTLNDLTVGLEPLADDGRLGKETLLHIDTVSPTKLIESYCDNRLVFMGRLKNWARYRVNWTRRVAAVEKVALEMSAQEKVRAPQS